MGNVGDSDEFLPLQYDVDATFRFWEMVDGTYEAVLDYKNIIQRTSGSDIRRSVKKEVNMTCPIHTRCVLIRMLIYVILLTLKLCVPFL